MKAQKLIDALKGADPNMEVLILSGDNLDVLHIVVAAAVVDLTGDSLMDTLEDTLGAGAAPLVFLLSPGTEMTQSGQG